MSEIDESLPRPATFMDIPGVKAQAPDPGLAPAAPPGGPLFPIVWTAP